MIEMGLGCTGKTVESDGAFEIGKVLSSWITAALSGRVGGPSYMYGRLWRGLLAYGGMGGVGV